MFSVTQITCSFTIPRTGPDLREGRAPGLPPTEGLPPNRSYFYFSLMIDAYETITNHLLIIVLVRPKFYSALCLAIVQFSSPFTLTEFIWLPGLGPSTGL